MRNEKRDMGEIEQKDQYIIENYVLNNIRPRE